MILCSNYFFMSSCNNTKLLILSNSKKILGFVEWMKEMLYISIHSILDANLKSNDQEIIFISMAVLSNLQHNEIILESYTSNRE